MEWQPIETAPKDGTEVLLFDTAFKKVVIGWYGVDYNNSNNNEKEWLYGEGDDYSCGYYYTPCDPTHWMPLPDAPK